MGITYTEVLADSTYDGLSDIRQSRDIILKVAKPLLDAGWAIHLDAFYFYSGTNNYTALKNKHVLVLKSPDNLFSIGFDVTTGNSSGYSSVNIYLYRYADMPSTVSEVASKANIKNAGYSFYNHPTIMNATYTNVGLVKLRDGGFLIYLTSTPYAITDDAYKACFGILPGVHCSSDTTINTIYVGTMTTGVDDNIFNHTMFYYVDGAYKSERIASIFAICSGGTTTDFEMIMPVVSYYGTLIIKSFYKSTRNNPNMKKGETILLNNKPYIVLYSNVDKSYLLAI